MNGSCHCFTMPSSHLVSVSVDQIHSCLHRLDPDISHYDVLGWCEDADDKRSSKQQQQQNAAKSDRKRQQQQQQQTQFRISQAHFLYASNGKHNARNVTVPFSHYPDPSSYIKEYTLYESYTSSYGVYPEGRLEPSIPAANKLTPEKQTQNEKTAVCERFKQAFGYYHGSTSRKIPEQYYGQRDTTWHSKPQDTCTDDKGKTIQHHQPQQKHKQEQQQSYHQQQPQHQHHQPQKKHKQEQQQSYHPQQPQHQQQRQPQKQQQQELQKQSQQQPEPQHLQLQQQQQQQRNKNEIPATSHGQASQESQGSNRHKKARLAMSLRRGLDLGVRKRTQSIYSTLEEYYAKQVEREMIETIEEARRVLRTAIKAEQSSNGVSTVDLEAAVLRLETKAPINEDNDAVGDDKEDTEHPKAKPPAIIGSHNALSTKGRHPNAGEGDTSGKAFLKLPALPNECCSLKTNRNARNPDHGHQSPKRKAGNAKNVNGSGGSSSSREVALASPVVRTSRGQPKRDTAEKTDAELRHSMPSLAGLYSTADVTVSVANPSSVVLPKLHRWLSDGGADDVWADDPIVTSSRHGGAQTFSREFLDYASALKNKDIFVMLHGLQRQKTNRIAAKDAGAGRGLPNASQDKDTPDELLLRPASVAAVPPPNTPADDQVRSEGDSARRRKPGQPPTFNCHSEPYATVSTIRDRFRPTPRKAARNVEGMYGKTINIIEPNLNLRRISRQFDGGPITVARKGGLSKNQAVHRMADAKMTSRQ